MPKRETIKPFGPTFSSSQNGLNLVVRKIKNI